MPLTAIRISDPYVIQLVEREQKRAGEATASKTAGRLIIERETLREQTAREQQPERREPAPSTSAA